jgi:hypothetical protein
MVPIPQQDSKLAELGRQCMLRGAGRSEEPERHLRRSVAGLSRRGRWTADFIQGLKRFSLIDKPTDQELTVFHFAPVR